MSDLQTIMREYRDSCFQEVQDLRAQLIDAERRLNRANSNLQRGARAPHQVVLQ